MNSDMPLHIHSLIHLYGILTFDTCIQILLTEVSICDHQRASNIDFGDLGPRRVLQ